MSPAPKWYLPVTILALLWNLLGCAAFLADVMLTPEDVARMTVAEQALYNSRPAWAVAATAIAVFAGALGSLGLILKKRWAMPLLVASLAGVIAQDVGLLLLSGAAVPPAALALQGLVLLIAIGLVLLAHKARKRGWIA